jgi:DNA-binding transcriptional ArsR family regulator
MADRPNIAEVAFLIGDPARANMLSALKDDNSLTATELTHIAGVAPNTASGHLAKLVAAQLVLVERVGRHRHFRLVSEEIADVLEALESLGAKITPRYRTVAPSDSSLRFARSCYDHLAGHLGVQLTWSLVALGYLATTDNGFALRNKGRSAFAKFGINVDQMLTSRRRLARQCLDWSERRPHLGGALGASLLSRLYELGWLRRDKHTRAVFVTPGGRRGFKERFHMEA